MLVERLSLQGHPVLQQRFTGAGTTCRIGRDLSCDFVVEDEHVAAVHALLTLLEDGRVNVRDLGTRNGTRVDGRRVPADVGAVIEQGELTVGRTRMQIRTRHTAIKQERMLRRDVFWRFRPLLATVGVSACIAYAAFHQWLGAPIDLTRSVAVGALVVSGVLALWTGSWSVISKLNNGRWDLSAHLTIATLAVGLCTWGHWSAGLVAYAAQWPALDEVVLALIAFVLMVAMFLHVRKATHCRRRIALLFSSSATLLIGVVVWNATNGIAVDDLNDVNRVDLGPDVHLGVARVVPSQALADYFSEVDDLQRDADRERQRSLLISPLTETE